MRCSNHSWKKRSTGTVVQGSKRQLQHRAGLPGGHWGWNVGGMKTDLALGGLEACPHLDDSLDWSDGVRVCLVALCLAHHKAPFCIVYNAYTSKGGPCSSGLWAWFTFSLACVLGHFFILVLTSSVLTTPSLFHLK